MTYLAPLLAKIIRQGKAEGDFEVNSPDESARVLVWFLQGLQDLAGELFFARQAGSIGFEAVVARFAAYGEAIERILGVPAGTATIIDTATLREWYG